MSSAHFVTAFDDVAGRLPGADLDWLNQARRDAIARFESLGFPTPRLEDWKYTNVRSIERGTFAPSIGDTTSDVSLEQLRIPAVDGSRVVFVNGGFAPSLSTIAETSGVSVIHAADDPSLIRNVLTGTPDTAFGALNRAFASDGVVIKVQADAAIARPIHVLFISSGESPIASQYCSAVVCERGAEAEIIETHVSTENSSSFTNHAMDMRVDDGATLTHSMIQCLSLSAYHVAKYDVTIGADARFISNSASLGARLARYDIDADFKSSGGHCELNGLYVARGRQHVDYHTRIDHRMPNCTSDEIYKGILDGNGRGVFNGRVYVHPDAQKSDASQANHNLLLSANAEIDTKPQLEIYADDVKASHGTTVGQLDEEMMYYLRTRGLDLAHAEGLLTFGFAQEVINRMEHSGVRDFITDELNLSLPALATMRD
ncbi:MAG: Fe-S cluster assembly protein SufD [Pseudomonadota bacterium]